MHTIISLPNFHAVFIKKIIIITLIWPVFTFAGNERNNQAIGDSLCQTLFDSIAAFVPRDSGAIGIELQQSRPEERAYVQNCFVRSMKSKGYRLLLSGGQRILVISSFKIEIYYKSGGWRWLGLKQKYKRIIRMRMEGWLEEGTGREVAKPFRLTSSYKDLVQKTSTQVLEESAYSFFKGSWQKPSLWMRAMQPIVVGSVLTAVIYLFFTVRS